MRGLPNFFFFTLALTTLFVLGCSKPPSIPELPSRQPFSAERIVLSDKLTATDIRKLFQAVNTNGALDAFKPLLEKASDEELSWLGGWLTRYFYRPESNEADLVNTLKSATKARRFTTWSNGVAKWKSSENFAAERAAIFAFGKSEYLSDIVKHDVDFIDPRWIALLRQLRANSDARYVEEGGLPGPLATEPPILTGKDVVTDLISMAYNPVTRMGLSKAVSILNSSYAGTSLLRGLSDMSGKYQSKASQGMSAGLRQMLLTPVKPGDSVAGVRNQLDLALFFVASANQNTTGLFKALQSSFSGKTALTPLLAETLKSFFERAISGWLREKLMAKHPSPDFWKSLNSAAPNDSFKELFTDILEALGAFVPLKPETEPGSLAHNTPVYLNAITLAKWFEAQAKASPDAFQESWNGAVALTPMSVNFTEKKEKVEFPQEALMNALGIGSFAIQFKKYVLSGVVTPEEFNYSFFFLEASMPLDAALVEVCQQAESVQSLGEPQIVFQSVLFYLTHPSPGNPIALESFETDNLMDSLNRWIGFLPYENLKRVKRLVFEDLGLASLGPDDRKAILDLLPGKENQGYRAMINNLLTSAHALAALDQTVKPGLPTALEVYQSVARFTAGPDARWLSSIFSLVSQGGFVSEKPSLPGAQRVPFFPSFFNAVQSTTFSHTLDRFSVVEVNDRPLVFGPFGRGLDVLAGERDPGITLHLDIFSSVASKQKLGVESLVDRLLYAWANPNKLSQALDISWLPFSAIKAMVESGDHDKFITLFRKYFNAKLCRELVSQVRQMSKTGALERAFDLLALVKDDQGRMRIIGEAFGDWQRSGELDAFLDAAQIVFADPASP